ncbi:MAG: sugar phosphate nucleotidyltransferase, partial [bacterium]
MKQAAMIMAGGTGTRFWPMSRRERPKQVLSIGDRPVMLQQTVNRLNDYLDQEQIFIVTAQYHEDLVRDVCPSLPAENIIGEPEGRDTAPCVATGATIVKER